MCACGFEAEGAPSHAQAASLPSGPIIGTVACVASAVPPLGHPETGARLLHRQEGSGPRAVQLLRGACSRPSVRSGCPVWLLAMRKRPLHSTLRWARGYLHTRVKGDLPALPIYTATFVHCAPSPTNPLSGSPWLSGRRMSAVRLLSVHPGFPSAQPPLHTLYVHPCSQKTCMS